MDKDEKIWKLIEQHTIKRKKKDPRFADVPDYRAYINLSNFSRAVQDEEINYEKNRPRDNQKLTKLYTYLCDVYKKTDKYPTMRWEIIMGSVKGANIRLLDGAHRLSVCRNLIGVICKISIYDFKSEEERFEFFKIINESSDLAEYYRCDTNDEIRHLQSDLLLYLKEKNYINDHVDYWAEKCKIDSVSTPFLRTDKVDPILGKLISLYYENLADQSKRSYAEKYNDLVGIVESINSILITASDKYVSSFNSFKFMMDRTQKCRAVRNDNTVCSNSHRGGNKIDRCGVHKDEKKFKLAELPRYEKIIELAKRFKCGLGFIFNESEMAVMYAVYRENCKA